MRTAQITDGPLPDPAVAGENVTFKWTLDGFPKGDSKKPVIELRLTAGGVTDVKTATGANSDGGFGTSTFTLSDGAVEGLFSVVYVGGKEEEVLDSKAFTIA